MFPSLPTSLPPLPQITFTATENVSQAFYWFGEIKSSGVDAYENNSGAGEMIPNILFGTSQFSHRVLF